MRGRLFRAVRRLVQSWWNCDRIRVSPREGNFLRTQPGDFLIVAGTPIEVVSRTVHERPTGFDLRLQYREGSEIATLRIHLTLEGTVESIQWGEIGTQRQVLPDGVWHRPGVRGD